MMKHCKTAHKQPRSNGGVVRFNCLLKERLRAARAEILPIEKGIRSILANSRSTVDSTTWNPYWEMIFGRRLRIPLDLLRLDPSERHVTFNFKEPRSESRIGIRDKSKQFELAQVDQQQKRRNNHILIETDTPTHPPYNGAIGCVCATTCALSNSVQCTLHYSR